MSSTSEHPDIGGLSIDDGIRERVNFADLPHELMFKIFRYLYMGDLARCALVSRKFRTVANHQIVWKSLYQEVFEYSLPLLHVGHAQFEFRKPHDWPQPQSDESIVVNPWKESFKQLRNAQALQKDGIHVRPGYASLYSGFGAGGRRLTQCDRLDEALQLVETRGENAEKLIFLHTGLYILETTVAINSDIQIIGASAGPDVASQVTIEGQLETTVKLAEGSQRAYLGWMTVRFASDSGAVAAAIAARNPHPRTHCALLICGNSTALVEHCVIHSSVTVGVAVCVKGSAANPKMRHCVVCDCKNGGIYVMDEAQGKFEDCEIARNNLAGVVVNNRANPFFQRCHIHDCRGSGIFTFDHGMGYFEDCNIHNNQLAGIEVGSAANPTVARCEVHHGQWCGIYVHSEGQGQFLENRIHSNALAGIAIESYSDPKITRNKIWGSQNYGVLIRNNGQGVLEKNEIFDNAMAGVWIETDGNPMLRRNRIYNGRHVGVRISGKGRGVLEDNDIYRNAQAGVTISFESNPTLRGNRIYEGHTAGIQIERGAMATLELNAIFHNRFGGLFLATDAKPTLRDNKVYDNDDLVEKTIAKGGCLFEIASHTSRAMHDFYRCDTCNTTEEDTICLNCIRTCHAGHAVHFVGHDSFICDCGADTLKHQCKLLSKARDDSGLPLRALRAAAQDSSKWRKMSSTSEHPDIGGLSIDDGVLKGSRFTDLPHELMLKIFGHLSMDDLTRCTLVSRKFRTVANHQILWKSLYQEVFEYSLPLLHVGHAQFEFRKPNDWPQPRSDESIFVNPWKESFKQLRNAQSLQKDGIHVRPGYASLYSGFGAGGRRLTQCDRLDQALQLVKARGENAEKLIFLHTGLYIPRTTVMINSDIQIIGASAGPDVASQVIIEGRLDTTVTLAKGSQGAYLGWMTVRLVSDSEAVAAEIAARNPPMHILHVALQIWDDSTALVEHCVIHSSSTVGAAVYVNGPAVNPKIRHCVVCDCESMGIYVTNEAQGQFEDCEIARNNGAGIGVRDRANPFFRRCHIHDGRDVGIFTFDHGMGYFESCNIHNNKNAGIEVGSAANPTVAHCEVHHGQAFGIYVHLEGRGQFLENRIHSNAFPGIAIEWYSDPTIQRNEIYNGMQDGIYILEEGRGLIEENKVYGNTHSNIAVTMGSSPIIRKNRIHSGKQAGVYFNDNGHGLLEENDIFNHLHSGVQIGTGSSPKIARNKIWGNQGGVLIHNNGRGVLEENEIFDNVMAGVWIQTDSNPTLRRNKIYDGRHMGVLIPDNGRGVLEENEVYGNTLSGISVTTGSSPIIRKNRIHSGKKAGVYFYDNGRGVLEDNEIFDNAMAGVCIETYGNPTLRRNKIYDGRDKGVLIHNKGRGVLEDNDIYRNALVGVLILSESNTTFRRNRVYEGRAAGIEIADGAIVTLESNAIFRNRFGGLFLATGVQPTLHDNKIYDNDDLVEKTVAKGGCLFEIASHTSRTMHDFYRCDTCNTAEMYAICLNCIQTCHTGHDVRFVRCDRFFCDCGAGTLKHQCKLMGKVRDNDSALPPADSEQQ